MEDPLSASFFLSLLIITIRFFWGGLKLRPFSAMPWQGFETKVQTPKANLSRLFNTASLSVIP
jgi:hypothetical protein